MRTASTANSISRSARREALLDAVAAGVRRHGPGISMEVLAAEAGVTKPILYRHFGDREGLVDALGARFASDLLSELSAALNRQAPPAELIATTIDAYIGFVERDTPVYRFLTQRAHPQAVSGLMAEVSTQIARVIEAHLRAAGLDPSPARPWAYGLVGMIHVAGDWWVQEQPIPRGQLVSDLAGLLWSGMASFTRPDPTPSVSATRPLT